MYCVRNIHPQVSAINQVIQKLPLLGCFLGLVALLLLTSFRPEPVSALEVSGFITSDTTWSIEDSPVTVTGTIYVDNATITIDAGVVVEFTGNQIVDVRENSAMDINGTEGNEVIIRHQTSTSPHSWRGIQANGTVTVDYAHIQHAEAGIHGRGDITVRDSILEANEVGLSVSDQGSLTTARNTFKSNSFAPIDVNADATVSFGTGADADILGNGSDLNGNNAIAMGYSNSVNNNCPNDVCTLSQQEFAGISNIPYLIHSHYYFDGGNDTLVIDPGVVVKFNSSANGTLQIRNGSSLDINGTEGNEVVFTDSRDDTYGGDSNNDGSATSPSRRNRNLRILNAGTSANIDHLIFKYFEYARIYNDATAVIQDSTFSNNVVGLSINERGSLTTARNTFNSNELAPIDINADASLSFGTGADADILGTGSDLNGNNALTIGYSYFASDNCLNDVCTLSQQEFAGINNIPYLIYANYYFDGGNDTLVIDPGVIVKFRHDANGSLQIRNGSSLDINGTEGNEVVFTDSRDDSHGGDTNNDGSATSPSATWKHFRIVNSGTTAAIDHLLLQYFGTTRVYNDATAVIQDSTFAHNAIGLSVHERGSLTTARNTFNSNSVAPIDMNADAIVSFGTGADADILGTGSDLNENNAIVIGYSDTTTNNCLNDVCTLSQQEFAGISNIPYHLHSNYYFDNDTLVIDPGVVVKFRHDANGSLQIRNGASLDINGNEGNEVVFTDSRDDTYGGDSNNDGSNTSPSSNGRFVYFNNTTSNIEFWRVRYFGNAMRINNAADIITVSDSTLENNSNGIRVNNFDQLTLNRVNLINNSNYGIVNFSGKLVTAENVYWNAADGPTDTDTAGGSCSIGSGISENGSGDSVNDTDADPVDYCPFATSQWLPNNSPESEPNNITGLDHFYPGTEVSFTTRYSDADGADNLDRLYLKIDHPSATDIEYYALEGVDGTDLIPTSVSGSEYVSSISYDRAVNGNEIAITWDINLDWDWVESNDIEIGIRATDDEGADTGYQTTTSSDLIYENDLDTTGSLNVSSNTLGELSNGDSVPGSDVLTFSGLTVVYQNSSIHPPDSAFDVRVSDNDGTSATDTDSSGGAFNLEITTDETNDPNEIYSLDIVGIPESGSDVSDNSFQVSVDADAPFITDIESEIATTSANFRWTTSEAASSQINYGLLSTQINESIPETNTNPGTTNHDRDLSSLVPCTRYYYQLSSRDQVRNETNTNPQSFETLGCTGEATIEAITEDQGEVESEKTITLDTTDRQLEIVVPENATDVDVVYQLKKISADKVTTTTGIPDSSTLAGELVYNLQSYIDADTNVTSFNQPISISIQYTDADTAGLDETSLKLYRWDGSSWQDLDTNVNANTNTLTATTTNFSDFAVFGSQESEQDSDGSGSDQSPTDQPNSTTCTYQTPNGVPSITAVKPISATAIEVYFSEAHGPKNSYSISYDTTPKAEAYGLLDLISNDQEMITIRDLQPNTTYYFKVRAGNHCAPGNWSEVISGTTRSRFNHLKSITSQLTTDRELEIKPGESQVSPQSPEDEPEEDNQIDTSELKHKLVLTLEDEASIGIGGIKVEIRNQAEQVLGESVSDDSGRVTFEGLVAGTYIAQLSKDGYQQEQSLVVPEADQPQVVETKLTVTMQKTIFWPFWLSTGIIALVLAKYLWHKRRR